MLLFYQLKREECVIDGTLKKDLEGLRSRGESVFIRMLVHNARIKLKDDEDGLFWFHNFSEQEKLAAILSVNLEIIDAFSRSGYCDNCILDRLNRSPYALCAVFSKISDDIQDFIDDTKRMKAAGMAPKDLAKTLR